MNLNKNKPITYEMTPSAAKAVNSTLNNGFFTPVTGVEEQEGINAPEPLEASTSTGYLPDATSREGQSLINKWTGKALIGSMTPEQIEALPRDYSKRVKDRINATILAGQVNNAQNNAGNFIFSKALPAGLAIAGLGPFGSLVNSMGFLPALGTTAASIGGGYLGATGLGYVGRKIDEKYGTKLEPWMSIGGGFLGGALGAAGGYGLSSKIAQYNAYRPWAEKVFSPDMLFDAKQAIYGNQLANLRDHEIRMNKPNTYKTVLPENGPTINAAGNGKGIIINPLVNRIYNLQVTKGLQSQHPSKLTREELIGLPKAERNNVVRIQNPIVNDVLNNHKYGTINPDDPIKKFVSTLDVDTHPAFKSITKDGKLFEHPSVVEFRNYLNNNGVDASVYSTDELSKLLTYEFLDKTKTATGALKDMILWHAAENFADYFKTKLGYPYKGKDLNLIARQNIINNNETNWFGDVVRNDQRLYELNVPRKKVDLLTGIKNIHSFLKQAKDGEQFRNSVYYPVRRYMSNASILNQNFGGTNNTWVIPKSEDLLRSIQNVKISTKFKPIRQLFAKGSYSPNTDEVWLSRFYPSLWKKAWRNPNKAIQIMHGTASHEGTHLALNHLNVSPSIKGNGYYISSTLHPLYQDVLYAFSDPTRDATKWMRIPEEFIAEMNKWKLRYNTPEYVGFNQLRPDIKNRMIKNLSKRFNFTPEDAEYIATKSSDFGYKNGGKL